MSRQLIVHRDQATAWRPTALHKRRLVALLVIALLLFNDPFLMVIESALGPQWLAPVLFVAWSIIVLAIWRIAVARPRPHP